ncbi:MAG: prepilin peptidase [Victivallaceae bacterium]|nr:prepilin peptidase [Victivallaceae bacterium]
MSGFLSDLAEFYRTSDGFLFLAVAAVAIGGCFGSFLNVCIWRMPRHESIVWRRSHCTTCDHFLAWYDNIPVFSYLILRGHCRHCKASFSIRYFWVELSTAAYFLMLLLCVRYGICPGWALLAGWTGFLLSLGAAWTDIVHRVIPDGMTIPAMVAGVVFSSAWPQLQLAATPTGGAVRAALFVLIAWALLELFAKIAGSMLKVSALGGGDIKFAMASFALCGPIGGFAVLFVASVLGLVCETLLMLVGHGRKDNVPFGLYLGIALVVWCTAGWRALGWFIG